MGIDKPYEAETGQLGPPPGPPRSVTIEARVRGLIRPTTRGVVVAGQELHAPSADPERAARELCALVTHRLEDRRPMLDDLAWQHFVEVVHGVVRDHRDADRDLARALIETIDGL